MRVRHRLLVAAGVLLLAFVLAPFGVAGQQAQPTRTPKGAAPFDPSGYWVPLITED
jgi:hypothetical protein